MKAYAERECSKVCPTTDNMRQYELDSKAMSYTHCFGLGFFSVVRKVS